MIKQQNIQHTENLTAIIIPNM